MSGELTPSARRVQDFLETLGLARSVREFPQTTRSAADAAQAIGCRVEQIAKSLVFRGKNTKKPVLVITSGQTVLTKKRQQNLPENRWRKLTLLLSGKKPVLPSAAFRR